MYKVYIFILLICFWLVMGLSCFSQVVELDKNNTPLISHGDSLFTMQEMWVQSFESELKQRQSELSTERKNKKLKKLLHTKKTEVLQTIDTLVIEIEQLTAERDSLQQVITKGLQTVSRSALGQIHKLNRKLNDKRAKLQAMTAIIHRLNKWIYRLVVVTATETTILLLILLI